MAQILINNMSLKVEGNTVTASFEGIDAEQTLRILKCFERGYARNSIGFSILRTDPEAKLIGLEGLGEEFKRLTSQAEKAKEEREAEKAKEVKAPAPKLTVVGEDE